jgi:hypothetical protein
VMWMCSKVERMERRSIRSDWKRRGEVYKFM